MDRKYIEEQNIVSRYIRNELTPEECVDFEIFYINKPDIIERLEIEELLYRHTARAFTDIKTPSIFNLGNLLEWFSNFRLTPIYPGLAIFCLVQIALVFYITQKNPTLEEINHAPATLIYLDNVRSSSEPLHQITVANNQYVTVVFPVPYLNYDSFNVLLLNASGGKVMALSDLSLSETGDVSIVLSSAALTSGTYRFELYPTLKPSAVSSYDVKVEVTHTP